MSARNQPSRLPPREDGGLVLGIDPGTRIVGYGAVRKRGSQFELVEAGTIHTAARRDLPERLGIILGELQELVATLEPAVVVVESAFAGKNVHSALRLGEARGLALASAARSGARIVEMAPASAKQALTGNGRAEKAQVAAMVGRYLGLTGPAGPLDATDALALALAHLLALDSPLARMVRP